MPPAAAMRGGIFAGAGAAGTRSVRPKVGGRETIDQRRDLRRCELFRLNHVKSGFGGGRRVLYRGNLDHQLFLRSGAAQTAHGLAQRLAGDERPVFGKHQHGLRQAEPMHDGASGTNGADRAGLRPRHILAGAGDDHAGRDGGSGVDHRACRRRDAGPDFDQGLRHFPTAKQRSGRTRWPSIYRTLRRAWRRIWSQASRDIRQARAAPRRSPPPPPPSARGRQKPVGPAHHRCRWLASSGRHKARRRRGAFPARRALPPNSCHAPSCDPSSRPASASPVSPFASGRAANGRHPHAIPLCPFEYIGVDLRTIVALRAILTRKIIQHSGRSADFGASARGLLGSPAPAGMAPAIASGHGARS